MQMICMVAIAQWGHSNIRRLLSHTEIPQVRHAKQHYRVQGGFSKPIDGVLDGIATLEGLEGAFRQGKSHVKASRQGTGSSRPIPAPSPLSMIPAAKEELVKDIRRSFEGAVPSIPTEGDHRPPWCLQELLQNRLIRLRFLDALSSSE